MYFRVAIAAIVPDQTLVWKILLNVFNEDAQTVPGLHGEALKRADRKRFTHSRVRPTEPDQDQSL